MSTPSSVIHVCSGVRLNNRYEHSIYFASKAAQETYFAGKVVQTFSAYSYLRKSWSLQVAATMEQARTWSYLYFRNGSGKTYYYFITNIEYKNDNAVELSLELDVIQTYLFDFEMLDCFVERQHTETDEIGEHTVPENLECGQLVVDSVEEVPLHNLVLMIMSSFDPITASEDVLEKDWGMRYGQIWSGLAITTCDISNWNALQERLQSFDEWGYSDGIFTIWEYPKALIDIGTEKWGEGVFLKRINKTKTLYAYANRGTTLNGYTPKNNKLLTYPYQMIYVTNNDGGAASYPYEFFDNPEIGTFEIAGSISPEAGARIYPVNYKGQVLAYEEGISLGNFPTCAWATDTYKLWLAQNQGQLAVSMATAGLSIAAGIGTAVATGGAGAALGIGQAAGGFQQIAATLAQIHDMSIQPPQAKGAQSATVNIETGNHSFVVCRKTITAEFAKIIDDFFSMYGYQLNRVRKPNIAARPAFTYVKTVGCHILGNMCTEDTVAIENVFDKGITFWKNGDRIADYSQSNSV